VLSLDATDLSGEHMREVSHNIVKIRLDSKGVPYPDQEVISGKLGVIIQRTSS
jgi:hypothetical protein